MRPKLRNEITPGELAEVERWCLEEIEDCIQVIAEAESLKEKSKDLLASIKNRLVRGGGSDKKYTETELERLARETKEWASFQAGFHVATEDAIRGKVRIKNAERFWSTAQSMLSYRRTELERLKS